MLIRILTSREGHPCGAIVDVADAVAADWIGAGDAEAIGAPFETAMKAEPETAMRERARGRK